jgi:hypothetical protein
MRFEMAPLVGCDAAVHLKQKCERVLLQLKCLAGSGREEEMEDENEKEIGWKAHRREVKSESRYRAAKNSIAR